MVPKTGDVQDAPPTNTDVAVTTMLSTEQLREMQSFDDALHALQDSGLVPIDASEVLGDGFELLKDDGKKSLTGVTFLVLDARISPGDYGDPMVTMRLITKDGRKCIINDGSTGIRAQVEEFLARYPQMSGLVVRKGLRSSEYKFCEDCKHINKQDAAQCTKCGHSPLKPGATFYLDTSK